MRPTRSREAAKAQITLDHPDDPDLAFLYGTILTDGADAFSPEPTANICVFAAREVDRSPTGSGVTARIALQHARGLIALGQERRFESVTGAIFTGKALATTRAGSFEAVTVEVGGKAHYTGRAQLHPGGGGRDREGVSAALRLSPRPVPKSLGSLSSWSAKADHPRVYRPSLRCPPVSLSVRRTRFDTQGSELTKKMHREPAPLPLVSKLVDGRPSPTMTVEGAGFPGCNVKSVALQPQPGSGWIILPRRWPPKICTWRCGTSWWESGP